MNRKQIIATAVLGLLPTITPFALGQQFVATVNHEEIQVQEQEMRRERILFNRDWQFVMGSLSNEQQRLFMKNAALTTKEIKTLDLPHDFQLEMPWSEKAGAARGFKEMGQGWYRKSFSADSAWKGRKVIVDFEGIMVWGDVYLNGKLIGSTDYGYLGAEFDITNLLNWDGENTLAVMSDTGKKAGSRWYTGGGLYRNVWLTLKSPLSIARHGVFVSSSEVTKDNATIKVQVDISGHNSKQKNVMAHVRIIDDLGNEVANAEQTIWTANKLHICETILPEIYINKPHLWSPEHPYRYTAEVSLTMNGKSIDQYNQKFGIRKIEFSPEFGMKINGDKIFLNGTSGHSDLGALGVAAWPEAIERQFRTLKEFGFNFVRCSHNPYSESFLNIADSMGIIIVDELYDKWSDKDYWIGRRPFTACWFEHLTEWVKRDRNHPSVVCWSFGNELQMREDLAGFPTNDWGVTTYKLMKTLQMRYDPTRLSTVAMYPSRANSQRFKIENDPKDTYLPPELSEVTDIASYNYQFPAYEKYLEHNPNLCILQSEATTSRLTEPFFGMQHDKMIGIGYWGSIDYWGESNGWPRKGWNFSFFDHCMNPYPEAYCIRAAFIDNEPLVYIGVVDGDAESLVWNDVKSGRLKLSSHWNRQKDAMLQIYTFTNADEVELVANGKSIGRKQNDRSTAKSRNVIIWDDVPYGDGGDVVAIAYNNHKEVARHKLTTTGKAVAIRVEVENEGNWEAGCQDLQYLKIYPIDKAGRVVPDFVGDVSVSVNGHASLYMTDNGNHQTDAQFINRPTLPFYRGFAQAILKSSEDAGDVKVTISCPNLKSKTVKLKTIGHSKD